MIESIKLETWAPDTDENNPSLIVNSQNVRPSPRGFLTLPVTTGTPSITLKYPTGETNLWYPNPVNSYTAYWADASSTQYALIARLPAAGATQLGLTGTEDYNGAIVTPAKQGAVQAIVAHTTSARSGEATTPGSWASTFALGPSYYGSFAQYGDYCFIATGDELTYIEKNEDAASLTGVAANVPDAESDTSFKPRFVAQAGDHLFAACVAGGASEDALGIIMDDMYWVCSIAGVVDSTGKPSFNLTDDSSTDAGRSADTPGPIIGMRGLDRSIIIYKRNSVYLLSDAGDQINQQVLSREVGPTGDMSVVDLGGKHVFMGRDDFYLIEGQAVQTLPNGCKEFLFGIDGDLDLSRMHGVRGQLNQKQGCVYWYYPSNNYASQQIDADYGKPICDSWLCWNFKLNSWTFGRYKYYETISTGDAIVDQNIGLGQGVAAVCHPDIDLTAALSFFDFGTTSNPFFDSTPVWNTDLGTSALWADSSFVAKADRTSAVFAAQIQGVAGLLSNPVRIRGPIVIPLFSNNLRVDDENLVPSKYLTAIIRTGDFGDGINYKFVRGIRPRFVGKRMPSTVTCKIYTREHLDEDWRDNETTVTLSPAGDVTSSMTIEAPYWMHVRSNARYHQFEFTYDGHAELSGYDIDYDDAGTR